MSDHKEPKEIWSTIFVVLTVLLIMVVAIVSALSCNRVETKSPPVVEPPPPVGEKINFPVIRTQVLTPYCLMCHTGGTRDLSKYDSVMRYVVAGKPELSNLCEQVLTGRMPLGMKMPKAQADSLCKWIADGALES